MGMCVKTYILFIFVQFTIISHQVGAKGNKGDEGNRGYEGDDVNTTLDDDISDTNNLTSSELRDAYRYYRKNVEPALGFTAFDCGMNIMKLDLELIWPECASRRQFQLFTANIMMPSLTKELDLITQPFLNVEKKYSVSDKDGAKKEMGSFFRFIYACLTRYNNEKYVKYLTEKGLTQARFLRKVALKIYGLTEKDSLDAKDAAFVKFALLYARLRQACNGYHHVYSIKMRFSYNESLPRVLNSMGLLSPWNFCPEDVNFINELHENFAELLSLLKLFTMEEEHLMFLRAASIPPVPFILKGFYSFAYENGFTDKKQTVSGFLPYLDVRHCPHFTVSFRPRG